MKQKNKRLEKGITLIALVITIIVLLILAGVAISMLTGENGILKQATNAKDTTDKSEFEEQVKLAVMASKVNDEGVIDLTTLEAEIGKIKGTEITKNGTDNSLPWTVKKGSYEVTITSEGTITSNTTGKDEQVVESEVMKQAKGAMPEGASIDSTTNENTGIVMIDSKQNEWVWIEVPATVFATARNNTDYENIKADLIEYVKDYREEGYSDEWYAKVNNSKFITANTEGITDEQKLLSNGCGLTYDQYNEKYNKMLSSIYTNKGFYIGRYETGDGTATKNNISRSNANRAGTVDEIANVDNEGVIKENQMPYNYVYCKEAEIVAERFATTGKTSSLMFGIQWDLVCKFLEVKGNWDTSTNTAQYYIKSNSTDWGNYKNSTITLNQGKYFTSASNSWAAINVDEKNYVNNSSKIQNSSILLTTGSSENTKKMNIYDLAGNVVERTLEKADKETNVCSERGGHLYVNGSENSVSCRYDDYTDTSDLLFGFRVALY